MRKFEMTTDLITGMADIDNDHHEILELVNKIISPTFTNGDKVALEDTLSFLKSYVIYHFAAEEYSMFVQRYHGFEKHCNWHEHFKRLISDYVKEGESDGISKGFLLRLSFSIEEWFLEHIRIMDCDFAKFVNKKCGSSACLPDVKILRDEGRLPKDFDENFFVVR